MFENAEIGIPCPKCSHKTNKTVAWIKSHDEMICEGCGSTVQVDSKKFLAGLKEADKAVADLRKVFKGFGKRR